MNTTQETIWDAAKSGDKALLQQCLVGATAEDLNFEKVDDEKGGDLCGNLYTTLTVAATRGHADVVTSLIEAGADVNLQESEFGGTALIAASSHGHTGAVQALIGAGADLNLPSYDGWTALVSASCRGHVTTIQVLIGAGADLNLQDKAGWTALMRASLWGHTAAAQELLEAGVDRTIRDKSQNKTAAEWANTEAIRLLINSYDK